MFELLTVLISSTALVALPFGVIMIVKELLTLWKL